MYKYDKHNRGCTKQPYKFKRKYETPQISLMLLFALETEMRLNRVSLKVGACVVSSQRGHDGNTQLQSDHNP